MNSSHCIRLLVAGLLLGGCGSVGKKNVVFVTRTSAGLDMESTPPALSVGYERQEFVVGPLGENGETLPVLTTASMDSGIFSFTADQSFATGDAAVIISDELGSQRNPFHETDADSAERTRRLDPFAKDRDLTASAITVPAKVSDRERLIFSTDTSFGVQASWTGESTFIVPGTFSVGYKRKELAFVPLEETRSEAVDSDNTTVAIASLIATIGATAAVGDKKADTVTQQTFATGSAATLLAAHPAVRKYLGKQLIANYDAIADMQDAYEILEAQETAVATVQELSEMLDEEQLAQLGAKARGLLTKAQLAALDEDATLGEVLRVAMENRSLAAGETYAEILAIAEFLQGLNEVQTADG